MPTGVELWVCLLEESRFWHIGTLPELDQHFGARDSFLDEAGGAGSIPDDRYKLEDGMICDTHTHTRTRAHGHAC